MRVQLQDSFLFGVAICAAQVEGAAYEDGRKASIWDAFAGRPETIQDGSNPQTACDFYHRFPEDLESAKAMNIQSLRFSFSWSRILPDGTGKVNQKGLDYYKRLLDRMDACGIIPNATIYHWDLPQAGFLCGPPSMGRLPPMLDTDWAFSRQDIGVRGWAGRRIMYRKRIHSFPITIKC